MQELCKLFSYWGIGNRELGRIQKGNTKNHCWNLDKLLNKIVSTLSIKIHILKWPEAYLLKTPLTQNS